MQFKILMDSLVETECDVLTVYLFESVEQSSIVQLLDKALDGLLFEIISSQAKAVKHENTTLLQGYRGIKAKKLILTGLGKPNELTPDRLRMAVGAASRASMQLNAKTIATVLPETLDAVTESQGITEGFMLGTYQFNKYKSKSENNHVVPELIYLIDNDPHKTANIKTGIKTGQAIASAVNFARDMVNHPANEMTPAKLAELASELALNFDVELNILEKRQLEQLKLNAFLAVAKGSVEPPKLIVIKYMADPTDTRLLTFVGKGITFDSGGISLKPSSGMHEMKDDMAGGATVLAAMQAIAMLKLKINIMVVIPCTENLPSGSAFKPGDVIKSMAGKTIEIISTDAEGRLILADAITYARKLGATHIVDIATLTGACVVALGNVASGVMSNDPALKEQVLNAAAASGEKMWELPLYEEYKDSIKSDIADIKNSGGRNAGAITAAQFLAEFADKIPWVHIDIAGTVSCDKNKGYNPKGPTGVGVRTLVELAQTWSS